jgi:putative sigma-54 modulation protein
MPILFTGRKTDLTPGLKEFAEAKLAKLARLLGDEPDAHVVLKREKHRHLAEIVARSRVGTLTARGDAGDVRDALRVCLDRALAQARKQRARVARERKRRAMQGSPRRAAGRPARTARWSPASQSDDDRPLVVPTQRIPVKPMSVEEAALMMQVSPDPFLVFHNAESQRIAVMFRRSDGRFGLIEPES